MSESRPRRSPNLFPEATDLDSCPVCGGKEFTQANVLWPELIETWNLTPEETLLIDRQQGYRCASCGSNLRSMTMAAALMTELDATGTLERLVERAPAARRLRLLEVNEAGDLHRFLCQFRQFTFAQYPQVDLQALPFGDCSFDIVVHGDTLEHVPEPVAALSECRRVLTVRGMLFFTIPIVPTRLTRRRAGLAPSYHGDPAELRSDYLVYSEYGADFFLDAFAAGFARTTLFTLGDPASFCVICRR